MWTNQRGCFSEYLEIIAEYIAGVILLLRSSVSKYWNKLNESNVGQKYWCKCPNNHQENCFKYVFLSKYWVIISNTLKQSQGKIAGAIFRLRVFYLNTG